MGATILYETSCGQIPRLKFGQIENLDKQMIAHEGLSDFANDWRERTKEVGTWG
jgi:hypothetical protein